MSDKYNGNYPSAWSQAEIDFYVSLGKEPAKTKNGLWVSDIVRESKDLVEWSMAELYALAMGELMTEKVVGDGEFYRVVRGKALLEDGDANRWGEEDLMEWLLYEKPPAKSPGGFFINDPERWTKDVDAWSDRELIDLGLGYFGELERSNQYILDEASVRFELPVGITFEDFKTYITTAEKPALTSNGVLINDRRRAAKRAVDWTQEELEAWAMGELESDLDGLLACAIKAIGGEWYWDRDALKFYLENDTIPTIEHKYETYTDAQLKALFVDESDLGALAAIYTRHSDIMQEWWTPEMVITWLHDGTIPEDPNKAVEPEPETEQVVVEEPVSLAITEIDVVGQVKPVAREEEADEAVAEVEETTESEEAVEVTKPDTDWTELVREGTALYLAMVSPTSDELVANTERRRLISASKWTVDELVAWARGLIPLGVNTTAQTLTTALRAQCGAFAANWTNDAVIAFIVHQQLPEGFNEGILVEDIARDKKHPSAWSEDELKAWAAGKVKTTIDESIVLFSARVRFKVPSWVADDGVRSVILDGKNPERGIPSIVHDRSPSVEQITAWLKGELSAPEDLTEKLFHEARVLLKISPHWTDRCILSYYRTGAEPACFEDGVYVKDRLRDSASPEKWKWAELKHLCDSEVEADFDLLDALPRIRELIEVQFGLKNVAWTDDDVLKFIRTNNKPLVLENGVFVNDPTRKLRALGAWKDVELKAWLNNDIELPETITVEEMWEEIYKRFSIPQVWYAHDAKNFILNGVKVPQLPSGIWIRDRHRDNRKAKHWTRREIKAWARGQILPGSNAPEIDIARHSVLLFGLSQYLEVPSIKKRIADITEESNTMTIAFVLEDLKRYAEGRKTAGDNAVQAAPYQTMLNRCIARVMKLEGEDFVQGWTELLKFFFDHKAGICSMKKATTGVGQMAVTPKELRHFQNMLSVLIRTCDSSTQQAMTRMIDWNAALKEVSSEKTRQNVMAYYGIH